MLSVQLQRKGIVRVHSCLWEGRRKLLLTGTPALHQVGPGPGLQVRVRVRALLLRVWRRAVDLLLVRDGQDGARARLLPQLQLQLVIKTTMLPTLPLLILPPIVILTLLLTTIPLALPRLGMNGLLDLLRRQQSLLLAMARTLSLQLGRRLLLMLLQPHLQAPSP